MCENEFIKLIVELKPEEDLLSLADTFNLNVVQKLPGRKFLVEMPNRGWLLSPDLEDLSMAESVRKLFWEDGSECFPRG